MSNPLAALIDSGKQIRIRPDKLFAQAFLSGFNGTVKTSGDEDFLILFDSGKIYCEKDAATVANLSETSSFLLLSTIDDKIKNSCKPIKTLEFIYNIIVNLNKRKVLSFFEPVILEQFSIKPEAEELKFLKDELEPFRGEPVIEILSNVRKHFAVMYFLLLTRFAGVVKSEEKVRKKLQEKVEKSGMFKEEELEKPVVVESTDEKLVNYLTAHEKFKNVFHLFELQPDFKDEKELHKKYLKIAQKVHPDKLIGINEDLRNRADAFFKIVNDNYKILKDPELRKDVAKLMRKYGSIKNLDDYNKVRAYDKALFKGKTLARIGAHKDAVVVFDEIYKQTKQPDAMEFKLLSKWKVAQKMKVDEKKIEYPKLKEELGYLKQLKDPTLEILFILVEINDFLKNYSDAVKMINLILKIFPDNYRARGLKSKIMYYRSLEEQGKL